MRQTSLLACLFMVIIHGSVFANRNWEQVRSEDEIDVYLSDVPDSKVKAFRASTILNASLEQVKATIIDYKNCVLWVYLCTRSNLIRKTDDNQWILYQLSDFPFPAKDRKMILRTVVEEQAGSNSVTIRSIISPAYCDTKDYPACREVTELDAIMIRNGEGFFQITRLNDNKSEIIWEQHTDPDGQLPAWLVNQMLVDLPFYSLQNLRVILEQ